MKERTEEHEGRRSREEADSLNEYQAKRQPALKSEGCTSSPKTVIFPAFYCVWERTNGKNIETSYKKALLNYHPDRSAARGGSLGDRSVEEAFKLLQACRKLWKIWANRVRHSPARSPRTREAGVVRRERARRIRHRHHRITAYNMYQAGQLGRG